MTTPAAGTALLRTQGVQFARLFQSALRLCTLYTADQPQTQAMIQRALKPLQALLRNSTTLLLGFQFDRVLLNNLPVADPTLSQLAAELAKRSVGFLFFSQGIDEGSLTHMLNVLATRPDIIEGQGGLVKFLRANPLENARIIPMQAMAEGGDFAAGLAPGVGVGVEVGSGVGVGVGVGVKLDEAAAMAALARIPRWLSRVLREVEAACATPVVETQELASLAGALTPDLTPEQRGLVPQLQLFLARLVRRANAGALAELIRAASEEIDAPGEELLRSILMEGLVGCAASGELPQAELLLRAVPKLHAEPESLLARVPPEKISDQARQALLDYLAWLRRPMPERLAELSAVATARELRWLALEVEQAHREGRSREALELLLALFSASGLPPEEERAEALGRAQHLLAAICVSAVPDNAQTLLDVVSARLQEETADVLAEPLVESLVTLTQVAVRQQDYLLAAAGAGTIARIAEEASSRGQIARQAQARLVKPTMLTVLVKNMVLRRDDPEVSRSILPLLRRVGDQAARELLTMLEKEPFAARRLRILQVIKSLGKPATDALSEKLSDPQWYVVRNAVTALAELADPSILERLEPALSHPDLRVQQAAVAAALKTRSPLRGLPLARALPALKGAMVETVLDDLLVLKEPQAIPYLEKFLRQPQADTRPQLLQKAVAVLAAVGTDDAAQSLLESARDPSVGLPVRQAALRAVARLGSPSVRDGLADFARSASEPALAEEARRLLGS